MHLINFVEKIKEYSAAIINEIFTSLARVVIIIIIWCTLSLFTIHLQTIRLGMRSVAG